MTLDEFKTLLQKQKINGFFLPRGNCFLGQDILPEENLLRQLTGFTGSAGSLLILTKGKSVLFVDGRYELQAAGQTDNQQIGIICTTTGHISPTEWMKNKLPEKFVLGFDPWLISHQEFLHWNRTCPSFKLVPLPLDKLLRVQPQIPKSKIFEHNIEFCGVSRDEKISAVLTSLQQENLDAYLFTAADSSSWLLNLRAPSLPDTPLLRGYTLIDRQGGVSLFTYAHDIEDTKTINGLNIYDITELPKRLSAYKRQTVGVDFNICPEQIFSFAKKYKITLRHRADIAAPLKCIKNPIELQGIRKAHIRDGIALVLFLHWLDNAPAGQTELDIVQKLREFRQQQQNFFSDSFATIAAFGPNGAIIHYQPVSETNLELKPGSLLLLDSGGQYFDGTTDVTRTVAVGTPDTEIIDQYTTVLKGHIALLSAVFPEGTAGRQLDTLARAPLWRCGMDYNHGTGHGVGCFLNVHEGPAGISKTYSAQPLSTGMITSVEPGYYRENRYGIRIENLAEVIEADQTGFLTFSSLTLIPYDRRLINPALLSKDELDWIDTYHRRVADTLSPHLPTETAKWLKKACRPLIKK